MKKALSLILAVVICLSLCACGNESTDTYSTEPAPVDTTPTTKDPALAHQEVLDTIADASPEAMVYYGTYNQDRYQEEGEQPIPWIVLENNNGRVVLMAWKALDCQKFDSDSQIWRDSSIRTWLNDTFFDTAFSELEQSSILLSELTTPLYGGEAVVTEDKVYLLSEEELNTYYPNKNNINRLAQVTGYCIDQGAEVYSTTRMANTCNWWLRSNSYEGQAVGGQLGNSGETFYIRSSHRFGIRPVICIDTTNGSTD